MIEGDSGTGDGDALRTIGEVAAELGLPQHVLRFWETRFPEIRPLKRAGGRRSYRPDDVDLLRAIRDLLYGEGYTIKGVQRLLRDQGARAFASEAADGLGVPDVSPAGFDRSALAARLEAALGEIDACRRLIAAARGEPAVAADLRRSRDGDRP